MAELVQIAGERFGRRFGERVIALSSARPAYGGRRLQRRSLDSALAFLQHQDWWLPDLLLTPTGNIQMQWRSDDGRIVAQFLPEGEVWFTVLERGRPRLTGRGTPEEFVAAVAFDAPVAP